MLGETNLGQAPVAIAEAALIEDLFGADDWVRQLRQFNVRYIVQLGELLGTEVGRGALARFLAPVSLSSVRSVAEPALLTQFNVSVAASRTPAPGTQLSLRATRHYGLGARVPIEFGELTYGVPLPTPDAWRATASRVEPAVGLPGPGDGDDESAPPVDRPADASGNPPSGPASFDLLASQTPVRNQFYRGTCVAFATVAMLEAQMLQSTREAFDLSEQYVYFRARQHDANKADDGTRLEFALDGLQAYGACLESSLRYEAYHDWSQANLFQPAAYSLQSLDQEAQRFRITGSNRFSATSIDEIKSALLRYETVSVEVLVFNDAWFDNGVTQSIGEVQMPLTTYNSVGQEVLEDRCVGAHAIAIVGYVDTPDVNDLRTWRPGGGYFIFKNSWGTEWAASGPHGAGYGVLPYGYPQRYGATAYTVERS